MEPLKEIIGTPLPAMLSLAGIAFLLLANVVNLKGVEVRSGRHFATGFIGFILVFCGIGFYMYEKLAQASLRDGAESSTEIKLELGEIKGKVSRIAEAFVYSGRWYPADFVFRIDPILEDCPGGFWIKATDPGYRATIDLVNTALVGGLEVRPYGELKNRWTGSATHTCYLYQVTVLGN